MSANLSDDRLRDLCRRFASLRIGLVGDLFLDKYFDLDHALTEVSIETHLEAYQVYRTRCYPGAGGTVLNNLHALGIGKLSVVSVIGDDGEGYELLRELRIRGIDTEQVLVRKDRMTPTYTKPMLEVVGEIPRELNRIDIKNRMPQSSEIDDLVIRGLRRVAPQLDALIVADQVTERNRGVITDAVRDELARLGTEYPRLLIFVDSRSHMGEFRCCSVKPNRTELAKAIDQTLPGESSDILDRETWDAVQRAAKQLAQRTLKPVFVTLGPNGIVWTDGIQISHVPGVRVTGPIDIVGAGDSTTAGIVSALCAGATPIEAATVGCLVASITIQQLGVTGTASQSLICERNAVAEWTSVLG